jgi:ribosomal protein S18 acetylase RimI-like enzyme
MQDTDFSLRTAIAADAIPLAGLLARVFTATYGSAIPQATLQSYQERVFAPGVVAAQIGRPATPAIVATCGGAIVGASTLAPGVPERHALSGAVELVRLYVDTAWRGRGVGSALLQRTVALARAQGYSTIWLCVWEHNQGARTFYHTHGFRAFGRTLVWVDTIPFDDLLMQRGLHDR